jgi:hypothetical protein
MTSITNIADKRVYTLRGYLHTNEPEYKRMYICLTNDEYTDQFIQTKRRNTDLDINPIWINRTYKNFPPGFFVKYNGKTQFLSDKNADNLCILDDIKGRHVVLRVQYKTYKYENRLGWNLTCIDARPDE